MKELKFEELTTRQKLGMTFTALLHRTYRPDYEWVFDMIRQRALGAVWIQAGVENSEEYMRRVKEIADYPILIITDAGNGIGPHRIGRLNAIGCTGNKEYAYAFGKVVAVTARKMGYNVVCNPNVDMHDGNQRNLGTDKHKVAELAVAIARGMHDGGVLSVAKHYPSGANETGIDSHTAESISPVTKEELVNNSLYPYRRLIAEGLLDGVMSHHQRFYNIDPNHPATLSRTVNDIIRELGHDGFIITDALSMMGIRAKYDDITSKGLAIQAGIDLLLPYEWNNPEQFGQYCEAYEKGLVPDDMLDVAVKRVLAAQHKVMGLATDAEVTQSDLDTFHRINKDSIYTKHDEQIDHTIPRDGKHFFVVVANQDTDISPNGTVAVDTFSHGWQNPAQITEKIKTLFPNATIKIIHQFPSQAEMQRVLMDSLGYDEVVFMTFAEPQAYTGPAHLTRRLAYLIKAMQVTDRISTIIHVGDPRVLEELPHVPRHIFGGLSAGSLDTCLEVLAGEYPPKGVPTFQFQLQ